MRSRVDVRDATFVVGLGSIGAGCAMLSVPGALIVMGVLLLLLWIASGRR